MITSETIKDIEESGRRVDVYDLFDDDVEYPDKDMLVNGVPIGMNYSYISTTYLNGFINYVEIIGATMIQRYLPNKPEYVIDDTIPCWEMRVYTLIILRMTFIQIFHVLMTLTMF